jgi:hypothetical protein
VEFIYPQSQTDSLEEKQDKLKTRESESKEDNFRKDESNKDGITQESERKILAKEFNHS